MPCPIHAFIPFVIINQNFVMEVMGIIHLPVSYYQNCERLWIILIT